MPGPSATVTKNQVLFGPAQLWYDLASQAVEPLDSAIGTPLGGTWVDAGGTDGGVTVTTNQSFFNVRVDQVPDVLKRGMTERDVMIATSLAEGTLENLAIAQNHDPADIQDIVGPPAARKFELEAGQDAMRLVDLMIVLDGWAPGATSKMRRIIVRQCNSVENIASPYRKDGVWLIPVTFTALYIDSVTSPVAYVDEV